MEGALFIIIVFGGGMLFALSKTDIGRALADRIRGNSAVPDQGLLEEVDRLRHDVVELQERVEFTERMLAAKRDPQLGGDA